jgi:glycerophosphoryl diester phosphodiesterase
MAPKKELSGERVKIYAHRGASFDFAEQSLQSFNAAITQGADGLECDVRLTSDHQVVCWHDRDTSRLSDQREQISRISLADFKKIKINDRSRLDQEKKGDPISFDELATLANSHGVELLVETKHPVLSGGDIEREISLLAKKFEINMHLLSFSFTAIKRAEKLMPEFQHIQLIQHAPLIPLVQGSLLGIDIELIRRDQNLISTLRKRGKDIFVWTVNDPEEIKFCASEGVRGIITDIPSQAKQLLGYP